MPRQSSLDKFLNPNDPAFESSGYIVTVARDPSRTRLYLLNPVWFEDAVATHMETGKFMGSNISAVVGYVGVFEYDGAFSHGDHLHVAWYDAPKWGGRPVENGYRVTGGDGRKPKYTTYKSLVAAATRQAPHILRQRRAEQEQQKAEVVAARDKLREDVESLATHQDVQSWVYMVNADLADKNREVRNALTAIRDRAQEVLDFVTAHPDLPIMTSFLPDARMAESFVTVNATRNQLLNSINRSPLYYLFAKKGSEG